MTATDDIYRMFQNKVQMVCIYEQKRNEVTRE